ncbi:hypothetical protein ACN4EE_21790 [Geminocystis sp. CENA526]|uniref:hypothetical protein n=1 Tax=Geminocystis sp. CENA526 TaxID=1355871 RepID=UPI003D6EE23F
MNKTQLKFTLMVGCLSLNFYNTAVFAQNIDINDSTDNISNSTDSIDTETESEYKIPPMIVDENNVPIIITSFPLNGFSLDHTKKFEINSAYQTGENISDNFYLNTIYKLDGNVINSLTKNNIFTADSRGTYVKLTTLNKSSTITLTTVEPQNVRGTGIQQTFTGNCGILNQNVSNPNSQCSYLPALVTDRNSIDPNTLIPTRIEQLGKLGQEVSPENLAILQQPGFQNRGVNGEFFGLDLYFPNVGRFPGNSQSNKTEVTRTESIETTNSLGIYRTRQIVKSNSEKAILARTIYGGGFIINDDNFLLNSLVNITGQFLPELEPTLEGSEDIANTNIHRNLFNSANNTRIPSDSFVIYHAGLGKINHQKINVLSPSKKTNLVGIFNSVWLGLSPVRKQTSTINSFIVSTSPERLILRAGGEGGLNSNISFVTSSNEQTINSISLNNFYIQAYISLYERDINFVTQQTLTETTKYYPHLSFTGNITDNDHIFRYYAGSITSDQPKFYLGGDYTKFVNNWRFNLASIYYVNPDQDYFSKVESSINKRFLLGNNSSITLSSGLRYAWNRDDSNILENPTDNFVGIGTTLRVYNVVLTLTQLLDLLPDSIGNKLQGSISFPLINNVRLNGYLAPQRDINNYGIVLSYSYNSDTLFSLRWNRSIYDFGFDRFNNKLETTNNYYTFFFKTKL